MVSDTPFMRGIAEYISDGAYAASAAEAFLSESVAVCERPGARLVESSALAVPVIADADTVWEIRLIAADVQGSSGYYPAEVLRRDGPRVFPAGTHVYFDHPTASEENDRPERSVRDLAGVLIEDARFEDRLDGAGLFARMRVFTDHAARIAEMAPYIGMSIRARGLREYDPDTDRNVVTRLVDGQSVDIVTHAGAGGRFLGSGPGTGW